MKTLLRKELRENLPLAVLGLAVFSLLLLGPYLVYTDFMRDLVLRKAGAGAYPDKLLPLTSSFFLMETGFFCAIFAAILGWIQIHHERHPDLWAFLVHRPVTRSGIFLGKTLAGLGIYSLVAGLPLICFILWAALPGHVAAPFEWAVLLPVLSLFLQGVLFYFAGMLTGLRQARWYASRGLGLGAAILALLGMLISPSFWQALLVCLLGAAILATAVWGSFHSHGHHRGQPAVAKSALTATLAFGAVVVIFLVLGLLSPLLRRFASPVTWSSYLMAKDGTIYKATQPADGPEKILDLNGNPFLDTKTGRPIEPEQFHQRACRMCAVNVDNGDRPPRRGGFQQTPRLYYFWQGTLDTLWYYWPRYGRLVGYNVQTRRPISSLGPNGFAQDLSGAGDRLEPPPGLHTLKTATTLYQVDLEHRTTKPLFTTTNDDPIKAFQEVYLDVYLDRSGWEYTIVVTRRFVHLLSADGKIVWKTPYEPSYPDYDQVQVSFLEPPGQFALWFSSSEKATQKAGKKLPIHVSWIAREQGVLKSADLPSLAQSRGDNDLVEKLMVLLTPPLLSVTVPLLVDQSEPSPIPWKLVLLSLGIAAVLWIPAGWWLGRRYRVTVGSQTGWAIFHLFFGLPGFLAFLVVQEWPAREVCPNCKKLRVVDRPRCEHCDAPFPTRERTGTEIFESMPTT